MGELRLRARPLLAALAAVLLAACGGGRTDKEASAHLARALGGDVVELATGDTMVVGEGTRSFYEARRGAPAWMDGDDLTDEGEALFEALGGSAAEGLDPQNYRLAAATQLRQWLADGKADSVGTEVPRLVAELDLVLSEGMARYASHLAQGAIDPEASGLEWRIPREQAPEEDVLASLASGRAPAEIVAALRPKSLHYERFVRAYGRYLELANRGVQWPQIPEGASVKAGESSPAVALLRQRLAASPDPQEAELAQRGTRPDLYDPQLEQALKHFQERHSIEADGALGPTTVRELNHTLEERMAEMRLNMDRWRWLPHELGDRYVLVNIAGFELEVVEDGKAIEAMNVVVGQQNWRTPIFADTMEHVVVNPYWNVPKSIYDDEIAPALERDPDYLVRNNMERTENGLVRQRPGDDNALGRFKFLFPNGDDIYLHDTPAKSLFSRARRDFSHGCIRLERPRDLANLIVGRASSTSPDEIDAMLASGSERWIKLDRPLPVYILYFTAWVQEDGTVRFHHDVYGRDEQLEKQVERKLT